MTRYCHITNHAFICLATEMQQAYCLINNSQRDLLTQKSTIMMIVTTLFILKRKAKGYLIINNCLFFSRARAPPLHDQYITKLD